MTRKALSAASAAFLSVGLLAACTWNDDPATPVALPGAAAVADFGLLDVNPTSPRADQIVSPRDYLGSVSAWYFGHATWGYCRSQFGYLDEIQNELAAEGRVPGIQILGVNQLGRDSGNETICNGRDLPWLQETSAQDVWGDWAVTYRDVIILDARNEVFAVFNVTANSLAVEENRAALRALLIAAGG